MITKEYGKYFVVCDGCDDATPTFDTFPEARDYIRGTWKTVKDKQTGEWENYCPVCARKIRQQVTLQNFDKLDR